MVFKELVVVVVKATQVGPPELIQLKLLWPRTLSGKIECQLCIDRFDPIFRETYRDEQLIRLPLIPLPRLFQDYLPFH